MKTTALNTQLRLFYLFNLLEEEKQLCCVRNDIIWFGQTETPQKIRNGQKVRWKFPKRPNLLF
jgi:hypothetical protein